MSFCNPDANYKISKDLSERINIFRLILIFMVIYIHSYGSVSVFSSDGAAAETAKWLSNTKYIISQIITRAAVPGFFLMSSVLLYRKPFSWLRNIKRKLVSLGIPYLIFNVGWIALFFVLQSFSFSASIFNNPENIIRSWDLRHWVNALLGWPDNAVPFLYPLWYLRDLLILNFLAAIIWKLVDKLPEIMLIGALSLWICYSIPNCAIPDFQAIAFWIFGAYLVKRNISLELLDKIPAWFLGAALVLCIWRYMQFRYVDEFLPLFNVCISLSLCFSFVLSGRIKAGKLKNALLKLSAYSFSIYLFHEFTLLLFRKVTASVFPTSNISQFLQYMLIPFVVSAFCVILSIILKKLMPRFYAIIVGGRI